MADCGSGQLGHDLVAIPTLVRQTTFLEFAPPSPPVVDDLEAAVRDGSVHLGFGVDRHVLPGATATTPGNFEAQKTMILLGRSLGRFVASSLRRPTSGTPDCRLWSR